MAGTDYRRPILGGGPAIILVNPQLGENIGTAARAMLNCGLTDLRLVKPRDGWPSEKARTASSGADSVIAGARLFATVEAATADLRRVYATTVRERDMVKRVVTPRLAAAEMRKAAGAGEACGILFGPERSGLVNDHLALADTVISVPLNPAFSSLNLAQAVLVVGYEWFKLVTAGALPFAMPQKSAPAPKEQLLAFFADLERELERVEFFRPAEKRATMVINLRNIFGRMEPTRQDIQTLHGVILAIAEGRKGPTRGGVLDGPEAEMLRTLLAEHGGGRVPSERGPVRGLSRLLRRNPTDAERRLWEALVNDRRFAGRSFKRQVPVGPHITDFVSFPLRVVLDLVPSDESAAAAATRAEKRAWLAERGYRVIEIAADEALADPGEVLNRLVQLIDTPGRGAS